MARFPVQLPGVLRVPYGGSIMDVVRREANSRMVSGSHARIKGTNL